MLAALGAIYFAQRKVPRRVLLTVAFLATAPALVSLPQTGVWGCVEYHGWSPNIEF